MKNERIIYPHSEITKKIISCAIAVHKSLGPGLLESVYEEALSHEFDLRKVVYARQKSINLKYKWKEVGLIINFNVHLLKDGIKRMIF